MDMLIKGIYRDGVFHPDEPVDLKDNTPVTMMVSAESTVDTPQEESDADRERRKVHEILVAAGVIRPGPVPGPIAESAISKERRAELARKLAEIGSIYDIIREERDSYW